MIPHPVLTSRLKMIAAAAMLLVAVITFSALLWNTGCAPMSHILIYSAVSVCLMAALGFGFWYVINLLQFPQSYWILSMPAWLVWLAIVLLLHFVLWDNIRPIIIATIAIGLWLWISLILWYRTEYWKSWRAERLANEVTQTTLPLLTDRITVKSGSRIHIIRVQDIHYVQACGDYVMLVTAEGEFLKEQTMKSLEEHLPDNFVRIHRSYLVNVEHIIRSELFGKESYNLHLRSGVVLRASATGYKALKKKLDI